jgi:cytochrome c peroxidase
MKIYATITTLTTLAICFSFSLRQDKEYNSLYASALSEFKSQQESLLSILSKADLGNKADLSFIREKIKANRLKLKALDFWLRYFEPNLYRKINGPLPVEWENEVFEKFEPPYKREGAGLSLLEKYLENNLVPRVMLDSLVIRSIESARAFQADSITQQLNSFDHFFLANRLYLLNLAALYTTGFECPDTANIIPELQSMMSAVKTIYSSFNRTFPKQALAQDYLSLYNKAVEFVNTQPAQFTLFDHFSFIRDYVNPLFTLNQGFIRSFAVVTKNYNDYTLNNDCNSIFDKSLYSPQNSKGIFSLVEDESLLNEIRNVGKLLFYDPILSANNKRSCASCHKPTEYFTDTIESTPFEFDQKERLPRNTPSLINVTFNHLLMLDGKHISLQDQARAVMHNPIEMNAEEKELVRKVMSCKEYRDVFKKALRFTPEEKEVSLSHIISAITYYYADFSRFSAPFDDAMNNRSPISPEAKKGFNLFMSKAQCGTCHFAPLFNGVKPPYIGSEFEVIGVPEDTGYKRLSPDKGRYLINPAPETLHAFRTGSLRNAEHTKPYMHNGVFQTLDQVIDFYDAGGGIGKKLDVPNQTLAPDSLRLTATEKKELLAFIHSLNERIIFDEAPATLPQAGIRELNQRKPGGEY